MNPRSNDALDSLWKQVGTTCIVVIVGMLSFWLVEGRKYVSRVEVSEMLQTESPFVRKEALIMDKLTEATRTNQELAKAINELRIEIAKLNIQQEQSQ